MKTEIIAIIDRSGSMQSIRDDAIGGFNTFLAEQQAVPGEARMTLALFDDRFEYVYQGKPIDQAKQLTQETFVPRGCTAMLDAIGRALNEQGQRIKGEGWAEKVIVCILTDGHENASHEFSRDQIKTMIEHAEKHDWSFVFLAANQDAFAAGAQLGINAAHTASFDATSAGAHTAYATMSNHTRSLRGA